MSFAIDVAQELDIRVLLFGLIALATCTWLYFHLQNLFENRDIPFKVGDEDMDRQISCIPKLETILRRRDLPMVFTPKTEESFIQFILSQISKMTQASGLILNTFEELEAPMISQLGSIFPNIYTVGPLQSLLKTRNIDSPPLESSNGSLRKQDGTCMTWIDSQPSKSVLYISFGSLVILTCEQLMEFWHGLVNSKKRFLWVIRQDLILEGNTPPLEFRVGTRERWCIVNWAPQEEVLAHKAVGGFLTHSGWNSTLEGISAGVPMICWPQLGDQPVNGRCVSEMWRIGIDMKGPCDRWRIEKMVRDVMEDRKGEIIKSTAKNALMARDSVTEGGSSFRSIEKLIEDIRSIN
ncbi:hypothetical protein LguiA_016315 [Lonicera macranthoides]